MGELQKVHTLFLLGVGAAEDDTGGTKGEEGAVLDDAALAGLQLDVTDKGAAVAVVVAECVAQLTSLVTADGQCAVVQVNTGVDGLEGCVDGIALLVAAYDVVAHVEGNDLLVVEDVLDNDDAATGRFVGGALAVGIQLGILFLLGVAQLGDSDADAELLAALVTLEHQRLTSRILRLVKGDVVVALGASDTLHVLA